MANRTHESYSNAGKLGALKTNENHIKREELKKQRYNKNPKICPNCGKSLTYEQYKRHVKFCSQSCAASWTNKHRDKQVNNKIKESLKLYYQNNIVYKDNKKYNHVENTKDNIKKFKKKKCCTVCGAIKGECKHPEICKKHQVFKSLVKFGFDINKYGSEGIYEEFFKIRDLLVNIYESRKISDKELRENWNYTSGLANFHKLLHSCDIKTYSNSKANKLAIKLGRLTVPSCYTYKSGWYKTWDNKDVYLRSSYELDYAKELDEKRIKYEVESLRINYIFNNEEHTAIPDFYIPDTNTIVEIKSTFTLDIQEMKEKFKAYKELGYNTKLILDHQETNLNTL